jgi:hypothetical protein
MNPPTQLVGMYATTMTLENNMEASYKTKLNSKQQTTIHTHTHNGQLLNILSSRIPLTSTSTFYTFTNYTFPHGTFQMDSISSFSLQVLEARNFEEFLIFIYLYT